MEEILFILNRNNKREKYIKTSISEVEAAKGLLKTKDKLKLIELIEININKIKDYYEEKINDYKCDIIEKGGKPTEEELLDYLNNEYLMDIIDELKEKVNLVCTSPIKIIERELEYKYNQLLRYLTEVNEDSLLYLLRKKVIFEDYYYSLEKYYYLLVDKRVTVEETA